MSVGVSSDVLHFKVLRRSLQTPTPTFRSLQIDHAIQPPDMLKEAIGALFTTHLHLLQAPSP